MVGIPLKGIWSTSRFQRQLVNLWKDQPREKKSSKQGITRTINSSVAGRHNGEGRFSDCSVLTHFLKYLLLACVWAAGWMNFWPENYHITLCGTRQKLTGQLSLHFVILGQSQENWRCSTFSGIMYLLFILLLSRINKVVIAEVR